ncbi:MAG: hypothetical protein IT244_07715, partial [Bacteroidia bacterium]|nr:hypothetical protein [Bacteroidia bacterium]
MKYNKLFIAAVMLLSLAPIALGSCKKGSDDPIVSLKTRNDRFSNTWTLNKYEKNGVTQDLNGSSYV